MTIISSAPAWRAAAPASTTVTSGPEHGRRDARHLRNNAAFTDLAFGQRRMSVLAAAGPLYQPQPSASLPPAEDLSQHRQKRFAPAMLVAAEINDISAGAISKTLVSIADNSIGNELLSDLGAADTFSRTTIVSAALTGERVGRNAGLAMGELEGTQSGMRAGVLSGATYGALAGSITGGARGAWAGSLASGGRLEGAIWGELAGTAAGRNAGLSAGRTVGIEAGREAGARAGAIHGARAGGIAGQKAGMLAGRAVAEHLLPRLLSVNQRDDVMQIWRIADEHGQAAAVIAQEPAERAAHEVGKLAGERAGILTGGRMGHEIARRDGELAGARAGADAGYQAGMRAGKVIERLARNPNAQMKIGPGINALSLARTKSAAHSYQNIDTLLLPATMSTKPASRNLDALALATIRPGAQPR
ncbi:hypothetical protein [Herbaspirillum autotrophicum]|uniref:hypothetical protein n=1 Tax=Herbaspirillum autotrophicum TaxID=180195 RepID=UPI00067B91C1|nr:hypothetical protein [Herbaspirillum autotrophicum]